MKKWLIALLCAALLSGCAPEATYYLAEVVWVNGYDNPSRTTYEYDESWSLIAQTYDDGAYYERIEYEYDDQGSLLRERVFDKEGCTHVTEYINAYDDESRLVTADSYRDGELFESWAHTYSDGSLSQTRFIHRSWYSTDTIVETFDREGNVLRNETSSTMSSSPGAAVTEYRYDGGRLMEMKSDEGVHTEYTYDHADRVSRIVRSIAGEVDTIREFSYTADTETEIEYTSDGAMVQKRIRIFDRNGNLIKEEYYDAAGNCWQRVTYSYIQS